MGLMKKLFGDYSSRELKSIYPIVDKIEALEEQYKAMTDQQLQALARYPVDLVQGFLFGTPLLADAFAERWLT